MSERIKSILTRYGITGAIGVALMVSVLNTQNFSEAVTLADKYRILCDAFTVPGSLLLLTGALLLVSGWGAFDGLSYGVIRFLAMFNPVSKKKGLRYDDFLEERQEKRKQKGSFAFIPLTGLGFMVVALVFLALFYRV